MAQVKTVTLVDPNGQECHVSTPADVNNLVYGSGYRVKEKGKSAEQAMAELAESGPVAAELAAQQDPAAGKPPTTK